jgi:hypothetical protein
LIADLAEGRGRDAGEDVQVVHDPSMSLQRASGAAVRVTPCRMGALVT